MKTIEVTRTIDDVIRELDPRNDLGLHEVTNVSNHRILMALALAATKGSSHPVLELGLSEDSTPFLHDYCDHEHRPLVSMEEDFRKVFAFMKYQSDRHDVKAVAWSAAPIEHGLWSVALIDHAPGDRRWADALRLADRCEILILHDTEPSADYGYGFSKIWGDFKSRVDVKTDGAWASAVSKTRDLSGWRGLRFGKYVVTCDTDDTKEDDATRTVRRFLSGSNL